MVMSFLDTLPPIKRSLTKGRTEYSPDLLIQAIESALEQAPKVKNRSRDAVEQNDRLRGAPKGSCLDTPTKVKRRIVSVETESRPVEGQRNANKKRDPFLSQLRDTLNWLEHGSRFFGMVPAMRRSYKGRGMQKTGSIFKPVTGTP